MPRTPRFLLWICTLGAVSACTAFDPAFVNFDGGESDAGTDASVDASGSLDASRDASRDVSADVAPADAFQDAFEVDAAVEDAGTDADDADASDVGDAGPPCMPLTRSVWVWDPSVLRENTTENLRALRAAGFGRVFLEAETLATEEGSPLVDLVAQAAEECVEVDLLFGYAPWSRTSMHGYIRMVVRRALAQFEPGDIMPRAIHLDIEPHTLPEWASDQASIAEQWVSMLEGVAAETAGTPLLADVPFWYHEIMLDRGGENISLLHWTLRAVDGVAVLAYRDSAEGPNGIVELARPTMMIADSVGASVIVGLETHCVEPTHVTFCEEGLAVLFTESTRAESFLSPFSSFGGMAIHSWPAFQALAP